MLQTYYPMRIISTHMKVVHEDGFKRALTRVLNSYGTQSKIIKDDKERLSGEDTREGLTAVVSVKHGNPQFEGQTKTKLGNSEVRQIVDRLFSEHFERFYMRIQMLQESLLKKESWRQEHV